ncbi:metallophosphoesterase family protein [Candidatus Desantisbacteria bacterium]|nr:metallophosphoesterase family protein [Candidatus Desantisbacteria bacterium]
MRYGIMSDIHSNLEALNSVLKAMENEGIDKIICLGDIVGYGPKPNECVERMQEIDGLIVAGNHDLAAIGWEDIDWFSSYAKEAILWTEDKLTTENKKYLSHLPEVISQKDFILVHGSLHHFTDEYIMNSAVAKKSFDLMKHRELLLIGHTHHAAAFFRKQRQSSGVSPIQNLRLINQDVFCLLNGMQSIVNVGSVGQPRDGDNRASFGILDLETRTVTIKRIPYDIKKTQYQMLKAELPRYLISRLAIGR